MGKGRARLVVDPFEQINIVVWELSIFENQPYPTVNHRRKGSLEIKGTQNRNVARIEVITFRLVDHGKNPSSGIKVKSVVQEIPTRDKAILCFVGNKLILGLEGLNISGNNQLIIRVFEGKRASLKRFPNDFNRVMGLRSFRGEQNTGLIKRGGRRNTPSEF